METKIVGHVSKKDNTASGGKTMGPMDTFVKSKPERPAHTDASTLESCTKLIVAEILPVSLVARPGFIRFMEEMRPDVKLPCVKTLVKGIQVGTLLSLLITYSVI